MDFDLSEEQRLLKDSADRFIAERYDFESRRAVIAVEPGYSPAHWATFAELGWLALPFDEADGGLGATPVETLVLMEAFGRGLVVEPYLSSVVLAGGVLRHGASAEQRRAWVPGLADGGAVAALAHVEDDAGYSLSHVATTATPAPNGDGGGFRLNGAKTLVLGGPVADHFIISARTSGGVGDADGLTLFWVDAGAPGLTRHDYSLLDGSRACDLVIEDLAVERTAVLGAPGEALAVLSRVWDEAIAALCAEAVGIMEAATAMTLDYVKTRKQFGQAIGGFQVIQHRLADMHMACEEARSMALMATLKLADPDPAARTRATSAAKAHIGKAGRFVGQQAIQLHGGMGMTEELIIGAYFKRLTLIDALFGNRGHHLDRFAGLHASETLK